MSDKKQKKHRRPIPKAPRGFKDVATDLYHSREHIIKNISAVYEKYGFDFLETSAIETVESLGKFLPDTDRPNDGIFAWIFPSGSRHLCRGVDHLLLIDSRFFHQDYLPVCSFCSFD